MAQSAERVKRLVEFKKKLETRISELDSELKDLQEILEAVNSILLEKGFRHAEIAKPTPPSTEAVPSEAETPEEPAQETRGFAEESREAVPLVTSDGELLATLHVGEDSLRVVPDERKSFSVNTPPFTTFFVERILAKMQERDSEMARSGQLSVDRIFSYNIVRDGDRIREILIRNVSPDRAKELKTSIRWTLEKMYEKAKPPT